MHPFSNFMAGPRRVAHEPNPLDVIADQVTLEMKNYRGTRYQEEWSRRYAKALKG
jgi:hypothetical protein